MYFRFSNWGDKDKCRDLRYLVRQGFLEEQMPEEHFWHYKVADGVDVGILPTWVQDAIEHYMAPFKEGFQGY